MYSRHHRKVRLLFALSDVLLTALAFEAAYQSRVYFGARFGMEHAFYLLAPVKALLLGWSVLVFVGFGHWFHLYERLDSAHTRVILRDTLRQCATGMAAIILFQYLLRLDISRPFIGLFAANAYLLLCLFRIKAGVLVGIIRREFGKPHYVMVVGLGERAQRLARALEESAQYGVRLIGFFADQPDPPVTLTLEREYPVHTIDSLPGLLRRHVIDEILVAVDSRMLPDLEEAFLFCDEEGVRVRVAVDFFPHVNSSVYLDHFANAPLLTFAAAPHDELRLVVKRFTDIAVAATALLLSAPAMAVIAVLIRLTSPGPAIFRQIRCGLNGRRFEFYKFRSMCENAEDLKAAVAHLNQKQLAFKIPNDPRLTPMGRWLRKFSVDEWPQLWNVLKGDMSLVGPRPAIPEEVEQYKRWQRRRLRMRPGLTCLWAVSGRDRLDFDTWMKLDMQYIDNWSLALDWKIILRTVPKVLTGRGAN